MSDSGMASTRTCGEAFSACTVPCDLMEGAEEGVAGLQLETLYIDEEGVDGVMSEGRGRRLTAADFIGRHPVLAVERKVYEFHRIRRGHKRPSRGNLPRRWGHKSPRIGLLIPVLPDGLLFGEAGLRSSTDLLTIPRPSAPDSATLGLLQALMALHIEEQEADAVSATRVDEPEVLERSGTVVEESFHQAAEQLVADTLFDEEAERETFPAETRADSCSEPAEYPECVYGVADPETLTNEDLHRISAETAELESGLRLKKQQVLCALRALALQKRSLQARRCLTPAHLFDLPTGLPVQEEGRSVDVEDTRVRVHLLNFCTRLVAALALEWSELGEDAIDAVYSVCEQHSYVIGCVQALSSAFQKLAEFRASRNSRAALSDTKGLADVPAGKGQDSGSVQEGPGKATSQEPFKAPGRSELKSGKAAGKRSNLRKKDAARKKALPKATPVHQTADTSGQKIGEVRSRADKQRNKTKSGKRKASKIKRGQKSSRRSESSLNREAREATPSGTKKASTHRASNRTGADTPLRRRVSKKVKKSVVDEGISATRKVVECQWGRLLPAADVTGSEFKAVDWPEDKRLRSRLLQSEDKLISSTLTSRRGEDSNSCVTFTCDSMAGKRPPVCVNCLAAGASAASSQSNKESTTAGWQATVSVMEQWQTAGDHNGVDWGGWSPSRAERMDENCGNGLCVSKDEPTRNSSTAESFNSVAESPENSFIASTPRPIFREVGSCSIEESLIWPVMSFEDDALLSLPSKVLRWSVRSKVGELIRGGTSVYETKRSNEPPVRTTTYPWRMDGAAAGGANAAQVKFVKKTARATAGSDNILQRATLSRTSTEPIRIGSRHKLQGFAGTRK